MTLIAVDFRAESHKRWLAWHDLPLGSRVCRQRPWAKLGLWFLGAVMFCSHCTKVVGIWSLFREPEHEILDSNAGWVLEREIDVNDGTTFCGSGGCFRGAVYDHPLACSDECERAILADPKYQACRPPRGYKRGGPHS